VTEVDDADDTGQSIPSRVIVYKDVSLSKLSPVKVTSVPPSTDPYLGEIDSRLGVSDPLY
jgi:hypothetical protein